MMYGCFSSKIDVLQEMMNFFLSIQILGIAIETYVSSQDAVSSASC